MSVLYCSAMAKLHLNDKSCFIYDGHAKIMLFSICNGLESQNQGILSDISPENKRI
jgi:hypothetical protein